MASSGCLMQSVHLSLDFPNDSSLKLLAAPANSRRQHKHMLRRVMVNLYDNSKGNTEKESQQKDCLKAMRTLNYSGDKPSTPIMDTINYPIHMKNLSIKDLEMLADELRQEIVFTVSKSGGHLSSNLGVVD
ncbi:hypothetical protein NE237_026689 [Protea cynaroides]|uniref:Uncharacterized protein n=1 Tax=Protea cynaroides TaxID=273540 RepID=A0A9Q0H4Q8_9MAGN|nr:hypothetical protein NE237_026689 [Protea cynaroides]